MTNFNFMTLRKYILIIPLIIITFLFFGILSCKAALVGNGSQATLTISPQTGSYNAGDNFTVSVYLNTNGQNANAVAAFIYYDKTHFQVVSLGVTDSIFTIEFENIINSTNGLIKISRSKPTPGVNTTSGLIAKINFQALSNVSPAGDNLTFDFVSGSPLHSNVFLDDGLGTPILSGVYNARYTVGTGGPVTYPNGSLIRASNSYKVYLVDNGQKRWIPSGEIFVANGYSWSSIFVVDMSVITGYPDGPNVTAISSSIPEGGLIRAVGDIDVYIVKYVGAKKFKRLILSPSVFNNYGHLKWGDIKDVDRSVTDSFVTSDLVRVVNDTKVYKLYPFGDIGEKRWVKTFEAFTRLGFDWDSIYQINQFDRDSYTEGLVIE